MSILNLNYKRIHRSHKDRVRTYILSLVKCDKCGKEREVYKLHVLKNKGVQFCHACIHQQPDVIEKVSKGNILYHLNKPKRIIGDLEKRAKEFSHNFLKRIIRRHTKTSRILNYSGQDLIKHIESLWEPWMNWGNYGPACKPNEARRWNIDHIKSVNSFLKEGCYDINIINALRNLRPLDANENSSKK